MHQGTAVSGEVHTEEIHDGAEGDCSFRHQAMDHVVIMSREAVSARNGNAGFPQNLFPDRFPTLVLPCIERTKRTSGAVCVDDSVHLPGKANGSGSFTRPAVNACGGRDFRVSIPAAEVEQTVQKFFSKGQDTLRVLDAGAGDVRREKAVVRNIFRMQKTGSGSCSRMRCAAGSGVDFEA